MDANWRPTQGTESNMDTSDWRTQLQPESRLRIVNKIMETLKRHLPISGQDGLPELRKIAQRFEEKIYNSAISQSDYLRKISMKMLTMENKTQNTMVNPMQSNAVGPSNKPIDSGIPKQSQVQNPGQSHAVTMPNQSQSRQQLLSQNIQNNIAPPVSNIGQTPIQNVVGSNSNMQNSVFGGSQRQMPQRQQAVSQQQQPSQNSQQYLYQQQYLKNRLHPGNNQHSHMQPYMQLQQQQQPNLLPNQLQSSQPSVMQTSPVMQSSITQTSLPSLQQTQQANNIQQSIQSIQQQHSQSVIKQQQQQTSINNQQQSPISQQQILPQQQQQQQQLLAQQSNVTSMQHPQLLGQQNGAGDMQQHQRLLIGQHNNLPNLQQKQQQLINQQNNLSNVHQQQLGSNVPGLQQQQQLSTQSGNSVMQSNLHSVQMHQSKVQVQQQSQISVANLMQSQGQQPLSQAPQQQLMPQIQPQPAQLQQQQQNHMQRDMQPRFQASSSLLQQQNVLDQQKQLYQSQRTLPESSTSLDSTAQTGKSGCDDWQEEAYQKIQSMKELYFPELNEMNQRITVKLQQSESLPHQPKSEQFDKMKMFKTMLDRLISFLLISKGNILPSIKDKMGLYEKQIISFLNTNRPKKVISTVQLGQLPPPHMHSASQPQSRLTQLHSHENQMNSQVQSTNFQSSVTTMPRNNMASLQHKSIPSISGISTTQQNMVNSMQPIANLDSSSMNSLQQVGVSVLQQNSVNTPQQTSTNDSLSSQGGGSVLQQCSNPLKPGSVMPQHQQPKQSQEQQILQSQQFKQIQQRQLLQRQSQLQLATKQQVPAHMQPHQMSPIHQINDVNDVKMRQGLGVKPGTFQQHLPSGQRSTFPQQQFKSGGPFTVSSPHLLQAASPQIPQHSSPQVDQRNLPSLTKVSTPLQSANSPFVGSMPSPPLAASPVPGDPEKPISAVSSLSNGIATVPAQSLAIGTPGISPSPLLAEFSGPDVSHCNALAAPPTKSTVAERPIDRLIKAVTSLSPKDLNSAVSRIGSVVSMIDRLAGSAPGNGSRAAVAEDLVAMTNCRLQARNFINQDGTNGTKRMRRYVSAMPLNVTSSADCVNDGMKQLNALEAADLDSATTAASIKKPRMMANHALLEEIREINLRLIETVVEISDEDADRTAVAAAAHGYEGTIVKCSYNAVALSSSLKTLYASAQMLSIQPLRLLVPTNYPNCSPILLDKFPVESSKENEDLSMKTKSRFSMSLHSLSEPMTLGEIVMTWDVSARAIISEYAQQSGGGSFSSKYGTWENCLSAA